MSINELIVFIPTISSKDNLSGDILKESLKLLEKDYKTIRAKLERNDLSKFFYYACLFFNRFAIPTKYFIDIDDLECFKRYLILFKKIESEFNYQVNILPLALDLIHWEIYEQLNKNEKIDIQSYFSRLESVHKNFFQINDSRHPKELKEYNEKKENIINVLNGVENNQLFTNISFFIPIVPLKQKTVINTTYSNKDIQIIFEPTFFDNSFINDSQESITQTQSSSNWQVGFTSVSLKIPGYIDLLTKETSLFVEIDSEKNEAHYIYKYLYYLLSEILWSLKISGKLSKSNWLLEPNDIEKLTYEIEGCQHQIEWKHFPSKNPLRIVSVQNETQVLSIDLKRHINWYQKCFILSKDYLSLGNSNLCIFWLNIGIESFLDEKVLDICKKHSKDENYLREDYYETAKVNLQKLNTREVYDEIIWPEPLPRFVPMFKKIKRLSEDGLLNCSRKDAIKHYSIISKYRNKLFHGDIDFLIEVDDAKEAIKSYEWIVNNFK